MIDLHVHSTFSDGSLTPAQLVEAASGFGIKGMALTDHDTVAGLAPFLEACAQTEGTSPVVGIPGVEISADVEHGTLHMLGYHFNPSDADLQSTLSRIRDGRDIRNDEILKRLDKAGVPITMEDVRQFAGEEVVGRPHFAQAMVTRGYVSSTREAFDRYLAKGKPAYAERFRLAPDASIRAIRQAGGVAVMAHPFTLGLGRSPLRKFLGELKDMGLQGVEVYYSEHSPGQMKEYVELANDLGLIATGGSDFHGAMNPAIRLGIGFGSLRVPDEILESLSRCAQSVRR